MNGLVVVCCWNHHHLELDEDFLQSIIWRCSSSQEPRTTESSKIRHHGIRISEGWRWRDNNMCRKRTRGQSTLAIFSTCDIYFDIFLLTAEAEHWLEFEIISFMESQHSIFTNYRILMYVSLLKTWMSSMIHKYSSENGNMNMMLKK